MRPTIRGRPFDFKGGGIILKKNSLFPVFVNKNSLFWETSMKKTCLTGLSKNNVAAAT
jgi:hypothetical protein